MTNSARAFLLLLALGLAPLTEPVAAQPNRPPPDDHAAWAAGFAQVSALICGIYDADPEAMLKTGGLYLYTAPEWQDDGSAMLSWHKGSDVAQSASKTNPVFCLNPSAWAGSHSTLVKQYLIPRPRP